MRISELSKKAAFKGSKKAQGKKAIKSKTESNESCNDFFFLPKYVKKCVLSSIIASKKKNLSRK